MTNTNEILNVLLPDFPQAARNMLAEAIDTVDWEMLGWLEVIPGKPIYDLLGGFRYYSLNHQRTWDMSRLTLPGRERGKLLARYWQNFAQAEFYGLLILARTHAKQSDIVFATWVFIDTCYAAAYWQANPGAASVTDDAPDNNDMRAAVEAAFTEEENAS